LTKTLLITYAASTSTANTTEYWPAIGRLLQTTTEANSQVVMRSAGVLSGLIVRIATNTVNTTTTFRLRVNGANGVQSVPVPGSTTGIFEDTSGSDTIAAGDKINTQSVPGTTGTFAVHYVSYRFEANTNTVSKIGSSNAPGTVFSTASTTQYFTINSNASTATEANVKTRQRKAGTLRNLAIYVASNARTTTTTIKSRKNGADGNLVLTINAGATGWIEDTTHSDTIAADDDIDFSITTGTGTENLIFTSLSAEFESTTADAQIGNGSSTGIAYNDATVYDAALCGILTDSVGSASEANVQIKARGAYTFSNLGCFVTQNDIAAQSTVKFRKNTAAGNMSVPITSSTTGLFQDTSATDTVTTGDVINYQINPTSVTGSHTMTLSWINVWYKVVTVPQTVYVEWEES
jgi:hypothetical protein